MVEKKRCLMRWSGWPLCVAMCRTKENRWFVIMATIATCRAENGKKPMLMIRFPVSWNLNSQIWHFEKIGRGLSASGGLIQKIYEVDPLKCPKCRGAMRVIAFMEHEDVPREFSCRVFLKIA